MRSQHSLSTSDVSGRRFRSVFSHPMITLLVLATFALTASRTLVVEGAPPVTDKTPVIFDTDIGDDIDDTWALALLLDSPELDVKLVIGDMGKWEYRAKLLAKFLETAHRTDIPVGIGLRTGGKGTGRQHKWIEDYDLTAYPGRVYDDGVKAIIDLVMSSERPITLICVGPVPNIREALKREPRIADKARFVGMHGSVFKGYGGSAQTHAEYNVRADVPACQAVFTASWKMTITPLDTCGLVHLRGDKYARVRDCKRPSTQAVIQNYRFWWQNMEGYKDNPKHAENASSTLFDCVAVYLAFSQELCEMKTLPIRVDDKGFTVVDSKAKKMEVATDWKDLGAFEDFLVDRLTK